MFIYIVYKQKTIVCFCFENRTRAIERSRDYLRSKWGVKKKLTDQQVN